MPSEHITMHCHETLHIKFPSTQLLKLLQENIFLRSLTEILKNLISIKESYVYLTSLRILKEFREVWKPWRIFILTEMSKIWQHNKVAEVTRCNKACTSQDSLFRKHMAFHEHYNSCPEEAVVWLRKNEGKNEIFENFEGC